MCIKVFYCINIALINFNLFTNPYKFKKRTEVHIGKEEELRGGGMGSKKTNDDRLYFVYSIIFCV